MCWVDEIFHLSVCGFEVSHGVGLHRTESEAAVFLGQQLRMVARGNHKFRVRPERQGYDMTFVRRDFTSPAAVRHATLL